MYFHENVGIEKLFNVTIRFVTALRISRKHNFYRILFNFRREVKKNQMRHSLYLLHNNYGSRKLHDINFSICSLLVQ